MDTLAYVLQLNVDLVHPDPEQPRKLFEPVTLEQLKSSIESTGFIDPLIVRENEHKPCTYLIVDGERRWRACKALNRTQIPCCVITKSYREYEIIAISQNIHRDDLTTMEKALTLEKILAREITTNFDFQQIDLISIITLSESYISELIQISKLDYFIKNEALTSTSWTRSKLLILESIKNPESRKAKFEALKDIIM
jgi:ParB family chromosome partitioning protein